ncbi:phosphate ABC transporter substrate-binding protein [Clostridium sp. Cult3]|uniref:phosphate ABC transporter substrate-binding protein n=1 Tax=Clostridium sp. Cult3 TaxID=2079004 RepID=UPI001F2C2A28|nr:phosphate ABC transporter substrate-binding protein [Clostridium sp. Cult3]
MKRIRKVLVLVSLLLVLSVVFTGCANRDSSPQGIDELTGSKDTSSQLSGTINIVGSTSVTPVAESLGQEFSKLYKGVNIDIQGVGSTAGIKAAIDGTADIGMSSRNLKDEEKATGVKEYTIAYDGIVIAVHPNNPVEDLDMETIQKIFSGELTNWKELGGDDQEILVISREEGSGTRGAFEEILELQEKDGSGNTLSIVKKDALIADGNGAVKANIVSKENSIGYVSLSYLDEMVKGIKVEGVEATVDTIQKGEYKISRPFYMLTMDEETDLIKAFIDFTLSDEGQKIVGENQVPIKQ